MPASSQTRFYHGSSPGTASGNVAGMTVRYKRSDDDVQDANYPLPIPTSGLSFSWRKSSKINFSTTPAGAISNLRWFVTGVFPQGIRFFARLQAIGIYIIATAADIAGIAGFTDTAGNQTANDATQYTSSSPLTVNAGTVLSNPNTGEGTQVFLETQMAVANNYAGGSGPIAPVGITYRYTET